jgi:hypothetical protein
MRGTHPLVRNRRQVSWHMLSYKERLLASSQLTTWRSGSYLSTCLIGVHIPGVSAPASIVLQVIRALKPAHRVKYAAQGEVWKETITVILYVNAALNYGLLITDGYRF